MTNMPEAKLAMEAGICYASVSMVTDYDCWHPDHDEVSVDQIISTLKLNSKKATDLISHFCKNHNLECNENIKTLSKKSIITDLSKVKKSTKQKLKYIIKGL